MKKLTIGLAVLLSGAATNSFAAVFAGTSPFCLSIPSLCGGFNIGVTGYWWQPSISHLDYALVFPTVIPDPTVPVDLFGPFDTIFSGGSLRSVGHDRNGGDGGYKINVGYIFPCTGNDVSLAFTHWDHDDNDHVFRDGGAIIPTLADDVIAGTIIFPGEDFFFNFSGVFFPISLYTIFAYFDYPPGPILGGAPVNSASAFSDLKYHAWDLEFGQYVSVGCNGRMRWFGGLRWTNLEHRFAVDYVASIVDVDVTDAVIPDPVFGESATLTLDARINVAQKSDFWGVGPRFGLNTTYAFGWTGIGIIGEASAALLIGEIDSRFRKFTHRSATLVETVAVGEFDFVTAAIPIVFDETDRFHHPDRTRIVPNLEGKLGLDYSYVFCNPCRSKLTIEAGYIVTHYFNCIDRLSDVDIETPEFRTRHTIDTSFDGPYVSIQFQM